MAIHSYKLDSHAELKTLSETDQQLIRQIYDFTQTYFQNPKFDPSHDFFHVMRVVDLALEIARVDSEARCADGKSRLCPKTVALSALLHDVGDRKYAAPEDAGVALAKQKLIELGMSDADASIIQDVVDGVSWSSEMKSPERIQALIKRIPELAAVQDADRLDAIGAIGIGRVFSFGATHGAESMRDPIQHFDDKLLKLQYTMKTEMGRKLAAERSERMTKFLDWWQAETSAGDCF